MLPRDLLLAWGGWPPCSLRMDASSDQRVLLKTKPLSVFFLYLGFGTLSSGTAVQTESGVFCSLNRPLNTFSMSSMLKAHTAEPGMLKRGRPSGRASDNCRPTLGSLRPAQNNFWSARDLASPVELCGKHPDHSGDAIDLYYVCDRLQDIKVEKWISGDRTVKPSLQKWSPVFLQDPLGATHVIFTYASDPGIDSLPKGQKQSNRVMCLEGDRNKKLQFKGGTQKC